MRSALPCLLPPEPAGGQTPAQFTPVSEASSGHVNDPFREVKVTVVMFGEGPNGRPTPANLIAPAISLAVTEQLLLVPGGFETQLIPCRVANRTPFFIS